MTIYQRLKQLVLVTTLAFWTQHWFDATSPEGGENFAWFAVGLLAMLIKTLPLWPFYFLIKEGDVKIVQWLSFAMVFYGLMAFWNMLGVYSYLGGLQLALVCYSLYLIVGFGKKTKKAFKAEKAAKEAAESADAAETVKTTADKTDD